jgi:hypothetical protein
MTMDVIPAVAQCIGLVVMAVAGIGLVIAIGYFVACEYFRFIVHRSGGFRLFNEYMDNRTDFREWLRLRAPKE